MRVSRRIGIQLAVFTVISLVGGDVHGRRVYQVAGNAGFRSIHRHHWSCHAPVACTPARKRHLPRHQSREGRVSTMWASTAVCRRESVPRVRISIFPPDLKAEVHSQSALGEQYVALLPREGHSLPPLKDGDVIAYRKNTSVPPADRFIARWYQLRAAGDPARRPQNHGLRRVLRRLRRAGPRAVATRPGRQPKLAIDARVQPGLG